jgi:hypothetical protein
LRGSIQDGTGGDKSLATLRPLGMPGCNPRLSGAQQGVKAAEFRDKTGL